MSWLRSCPSTKRFIPVPPNPEREYQIRRFHTGWPPSGHRPEPIAGSQWSVESCHPFPLHWLAELSDSTDVSELCQLRLLRSPALGIVSRAKPRPAPGVLQSGTVGCSNDSVC